MKIANSTHRDACKRGELVMGEPDIKLARIDNRLIHGQVATQWNGTL